MIYLISLEYILRNFIYAYLWSAEMADHNETLQLVFCVEHHKEVLQLFCLDCEDIICVSCNVESHYRNGHKLSKLG